MKRCWLDLRDAGDLRDALVEEAIHQGVDAIVAADKAGLVGLPPTVTRVLFPAGGVPDDLDGVDLVIVDPLRHGDLAGLASRHPETAFARYVEIVDADTLEVACASARTEAHSVLRFRDPTMIPLEIVLAAAAAAKGRVITVADSPAEAEIIFGVLEHGSEGVLMAPRAVGDATRLAAAARTRPADLALTTVQVTRITSVGMGERACVDTCACLRRNEGILVGSHARGMILCVSETHPLPYMPTRPFRVNAGAIMSYTLDANERTRYLSELHSGATVLAVDSDGHSRLVTVGRVKIETRPLLSVDAVAPDGRPVNVILQNDWHVRVLGPGGVVLNSTALKPGDEVLGYLPIMDRHVGYPIDEFCVEQ